jgi:tetratricopeptide (TPR) repeat protein
MRRPLLAAILLLALPVLPARADQAETLCARNTEPAQIIAACTDAINEKVLRDAARAQAYATRGWAHFDKDIGAAQADFEAAVRLDGENVSGLLGRAVIAGRQDHSEAALADFARAEKLAPNNQGLHSYRAQFFINQSRYAEAVADADFQRYGAGAGNTFLNLRCRARAYGGIELDKARLACDQALWTQPDLPPLLEARGVVALKQKRYEAALGDFTRLCINQPQAARSWYGKALAESGLGRNAEAEADLGHAGRLNSNIAAIFASMGLPPG